MRKDGAMPETILLLQDNASKAAIVREMLVKSSDPPFVVEWVRSCAAALFIEKERAQVTLNSIGDGVISTDVAGNVTYLNPVAEAMTGWTSTEALGRTFGEVFRIIDSTNPEHTVNPMAIAMRQNKTVGLSGSCVLIRHAGIKSAIEDSAAPIHDPI